MSCNVIVVHVGEDPPAGYDASIFLCGPRPRLGAVDSWRGQAIDEITRQWRGAGDLVVFVPEPRSGALWSEHDEGRGWERHWGDRADVVLFWIPGGPGRPGHAVGDEFGRWKDSGRAVLGAPPGAPGVRYQRDDAAEAGVPLADDLAGTVAHALEHIGPGARRVGGHRDVPLLLWRTDSFRSWLAAHEDVGNQLRSGRLEWTFRVGPRREVVFFWAFHAVVWIAAEQREKSNEVVLSRPDLSMVVAYRRAPRLGDTEVVIIREFRTPASTGDAFVRELPGGSAFHPTAPPDQGGAELPLVQAVAELAEETGIVVAPERIRAHQIRQPAATLSAHRQHVFAVELTEAEMARARRDSRSHGVAEDTELTHVEVHRYTDLLHGELVDWATLGAITSVLLATPTAAAAS